MTLPSPAPSAAGTDPIKARPIGLSSLSTANRIGRRTGLALADRLYTAVRNALSLQDSERRATRRTFYDAVASQFERPSSHRFCVEARCSGKGDNEDNPVLLVKFDSLETATIRVVSFPFYHFCFIDAL